MNIDEFEFDEVIIMETAPTRLSNGEIDPDMDREEIDKIIYDHIKYHMARSPDDEMYTAWYDLITALGLADYRDN